jgi:hypothetical protein
MKKALTISALIILSCFFVACNNETESAASIAQKWCDLNGKAYKAAEGSEKEAAQKNLKDFEKDMETKHKDDKAFMSEIEKEVEKCEDASEGR